MSNQHMSGQQRTAAARAARTAAKHRRMADELRAAGYTVTPRGTATGDALAQLRADLAEAEAEDQGRMQGYEINQHIGYINGLKHALAVIDPS